MSDFVKAECILCTRVYVCVNNNLSTPKTRSKFKQSDAPAAAVAAARAQKLADENAKNSSRSAPVAELSLLLSARSELTLENGLNPSRLEIDREPKLGEELWLLRLWLYLSASSVGFA